jgi:hypothetical protein
MILLLFWCHEPCIRFFLRWFNTYAWRSYKCYPGSIEKLKLLGVTYLLYLLWTTLSSHDKLRPFTQMAHRGTQDASSGAYSNNRMPTVCPPVWHLWEVKAHYRFNILKLYFVWPSSVLPWCNQEPLMSWPRMVRDAASWWKMPCFATEASPTNNLVLLLRWSGQSLESSVRMLSAYSSI